MQHYNSINDAKLQILQQIKNTIDRDIVCRMHKISKSKLSRILNNEVRCDDLFFDYLCQHANVRLHIVVE